MVETAKAHLRDHAQLGPDGLLFWRDDGGHVTDTEWRTAWLRACNATGVEGVRFHDLRHVGLTYTAFAGATIRELQAIAGHTTPAMALRYQEVAADHMAEVVKSLDAIISGGTQVRETVGEVWPDAPGEGLLRKAGSRVRHDFRCGKS